MQLTDEVFNDICEGNLNDENFLKFIKYILNFLMDKI